MAKARYVYPRSKHVLSHDSAALQEFEEGDRVRACVYCGCGVGDEVLCYRLLCSASSCRLMPTSLLQDDDEEDEDEDFGATIGESGSEFESDDESSDDYSEASEDDSDDESEELSSEGKCGKRHEREKG